MEEGEGRVTWDVIIISITALHFLDIISAHPLLATLNLHIHHHHRHTRIRNLFLHRLIFRFHVPHAKCISTAIVILINLFIIFKPRPIIKFIPQRIKHLLLILPHLLLAHHRNKLALQVLLLHLRPSTPATHSPPPLIRHFPNVLHLHIPREVVAVIITFILSLPLRHLLRYACATVQCTQSICLSATDATTFASIPFTHGHCASAHSSPPRKFMTRWL